MTPGFNRGCTVLALYLLLLLPTGRVLAEPLKWEDTPFSQDPEKVAAALMDAPLPEEVDAEVLLEESCWQFDEQGRARVTFYQVVRVITAAGVSKWSSVRVPFSPWYEERPQVRARVITTDGTAYELDANSLGEFPLKQDMENVFSDRRVVQAPLPAVGPGALIEQQIVVQDREPYFAAGTANRFELVRAVPVRKQRLILESPTTLPLRYVVRGTSLEPVRDEQDGTVRLTFQCDNVKPPDEIEYYQPLADPLWPHIVFSTGESWGAVAAEYARLVEGQLDVESVRPVIADLLDQKLGRQELIEQLLRRTQQLTRYTGLEFGQSAIVPYRAGQTLARRYGDCKDQSTLLVAMLRAAGQEAYVALVSGGKAEDIPPDAPGLGFFNHAIVYVPGDPPLWIDPTVTHARLGQLSVEVQGRQALVAAASTSKLQLTPRSTSQENRYTERRRYVLKATGKAQVTEMLEVTGNPELRLRQSYADKSPAALRDWWMEYAEASYKTRELADLQYPSLNDFSKPFRVRAEIESALCAQVTDTRAVVRISPANVFQRLPSIFHSSTSAESDNAQSADGRRQKPVELRETYLYDLQLKFVLPPGYYAETLPEAESQKIGPAEFQAKYSIDECGSIVASYRFDVGNGRLTAEQFHELRDVVTRWKGGESIELQAYHKARRLLDRGDLHAAFQEYRKLLAAHPATASVHAQFASTLVSQGFGEAAREHARRAVELEPDSARSHAVLAEILTHDLFGREYASGLDWHGAAAAFERSLELDPVNWYVRWGYAQLLERNELGHRYAEDSRLADALEQYGRIRSEISREHEQRLLSAHCYVLLHLHRFEELKALASQMSNDRTRSALLITAAMAEQGTEGVAKEVGSIPGSESRQIELLAACTLLDRACLHQEAFMLFELAEKYGDAERLSSMRRPLERLKDFDHAVLPADDPRAPVQQLLAELLKGSRASSLRPLFASEVPEQEITTALQFWNAYVQPNRQKAIERGYSPARLADESLRAALEAEGDDTIGYRIVASDFMGSESSLTFYVVREANHYRLDNPSFSRWHLGDRALRALEKGDKKRAEELLDWAWQDLKAGLSWFDPFQGSPFAGLYISTNKEQPDEMRVAAAALAARGSAAGRLEKIVDLLSQARQEETTELRQLHIDRALLASLHYAIRYQDLVEVTERILDRHPDQTEVLLVQGFALLQLGEHQQLEKLIDKHIGKQNPAALLFAMDLATRRGAFDEAAEYSAKLQQVPGASPQILNNAAWQCLFLDQLPESALVHARQAAEQIKHTKTRVLHTLACIYAERGETSNARSTLNRLLELQGDDPGSENWYIVGRMAEHCRLADVAASAYRKVEKSKEPNIENSTFSLAQRRLAGLQQ